MVDLPLQAGCQGGDPHEVWSGRGAVRGGGRRAVPWSAWCVVGVPVPCRRRGGGRRCRCRGAAWWCRRAGACRGGVVGVVVVLDWPRVAVSPYRHDLPHVQPLCDCQETPTADASTRPGVPPDRRAVDSTQTSLDVVLIADRGVGVLAVGDIELPAGVDPIER